LQRQGIPLDDAAANLGFSGRTVQRYRACQAGEHKRKGLGTYYYCYVFVNTFSRKIGAAEVHYVECGNSSPYEVPHMVPREAIHGPIRRNALAGQVRQLVQRLAPAQVDGLGKRVTGHGPSALI
jgi:hypothetical protein